MGHIFISYSHKDTNYAHALADNLKGMGFDIWIDERLDYGSQWPLEIQRQLDSCDAFLIIMTPRSFESDWVQSELQRAKRKLKPIFPLLLEGDEPWLSVESTQYYDVRGEKFPDAKFYSALKRVVVTGQAASTLGLSKKAIQAKRAEAAPKPKARTGIIFGVLGILGAVAVVCIGVVFIGMRFLLPRFQPPLDSQSTLVPGLTATQTPVPPSATSVPPTATSSVGHIPVIDSVDLREDSSSGSLVIFQDIYFHDEDGDAYYIDFVLVSDLPNVSTKDGPIEASSQQQKSGAIHTGTWRCGDGSYQVTLQATILDRAGNRSNTIEYTMFCHN